MMSCLYLGRLKHPSQMLRNSRVAGLKYLSEKNISQSSFPHACFSKKNGFKFLGIKQAYMSTDHKNDITEKDNNIDKSTQNSNVDNGIYSIPPQDFYNQEEELDKEFLDIAAAALSENGIENIFVPNDKQVTWEYLLKDTDSLIEENKFLEDLEASLTNPSTKKFSGGVPKNNLFQKDENMIDDVFDDEGDDNNEAEDDDEVEDFGIELGEDEIEDGDGSDDYYDSDGQEDVELLNSSLDVNVLDSDKKEFEIVREYAQPELAEHLMNKMDDGITAVLNPADLNYTNFSTKEENFPDEVMSKFIDDTRPEKFRDDCQSDRACPGKRQRKGQKGIFACHIVDLDEVNPFDIRLLQRFVTIDSEIKNRKESGLCSKCQRYVAKTIKHSRNLGLLPHLGEFHRLDATPFKGDDLNFHRPVKGSSKVQSKTIIR